MKNKTLTYLLSAGLVLLMTSMGMAQTSASHTVRIVVLRPNEMILAENDLTENMNTFNLNWKSHNLGQKITVVSDNMIPESNIKIVSSDMSGENSHSEIPITEIPTNLISENHSNKGNCQLQFVTDNKRGNKTTPSTVMYTLTDV